MEDLESVRSRFHRLQKTDYQNITETLTQNRKRGNTPHLGYEAHKKIFLPKADEGNMRKEDYRLIALMNTDTNSLNRILANRMKQDIKRQHIMVKLGRESISQKCKTGSTLKSTNIVIPFMDQMRKFMWNSLPIKAEELFDKIQHQLMVES